MKCKDCKYWRDKAWVGDEGIGICDNEKTQSQIKIMSVYLMQATMGLPEFQAQFIHDSMRVHSEFGCINFENKSS